MTRVAVAPAIELGYAAARLSLITADLNMLPADSTQVHHSACISRYRVWQRTEAHSALRSALYASGRQHL
jgi:hypothetical protein